MQTQRTPGTPPHLTPFTIACCWNPWEPTSSFLLLGLNHSKATTTWWQPTKVARSLNSTAITPLVSTRPIQTSRVRPPPNSALHLPICPANIGVATYSCPRLTRVSLNSPGGSRPMPRPTTTRLPPSSTTSTPATDTRCNWATSPHAIPSPIFFSNASRDIASISLPLWP